MWMVLIVMQQILYTICYVDGTRCNAANSLYYMAEYAYFLGVGQS